MQTHKKLKARILSLALSVAMVTTMMPATVFGAEGDNMTLGTSSVGTIQSFEKLEDRFIPSVGENAPDHVYALSVALNTPFEDLDLPDELTAMVERTNVTAPAEDEPIVDSGKTDEPATDEVIPDEDKSDENVTVPDGDADIDDTVSGNQPASPSDAKEEVKEEIKDDYVPLIPEAEDVETVVTTVKKETVPVIWQSNKEYKSDENSKFIYTAVLTEDYILADVVELPQIYVLVGKQARMTNATTIIVGGDKASNSASLNGPYPATVEGLSYAFSEAVDGDTIQLGANISDSTGFPALFNPSTLSTVTFDLNGKTLSSTGSISGGTGIIGVAANQANATLNITDSAGGGKIICDDCAAISASGYSAFGGSMYTATLNISGGTITSTKGIAIYNDASAGGIANVNVSGGTISAPIVYMKVDNNGTYTTSLKITGGSIKGDLADSDDGALPIPKNGSNADIYLTTITLSGVTEEKAVTAITGAGSYSANGLRTDSSGKVYFWLPENTVITAVTAGGTVYSGSVTTATNNAAAATFTSGPSITVGTQPTSPAAMTYGAITGSLTVAGTASNNNTVSYQWYKNTTNSATGGTAVTGATNASFTIPTALDTGTYYYYCILKATGCADKASNVATVTVNKANATAAMKTVTTNVSKDGKAGATVSLPTKPAGATYGTPTASGTISMTAMSVSGDTLTYTAPASTAGQTGVITIPVTTATNYNDYSITVTITSVDKTPITIGGVAAPATMPKYTGAAVANSLFGTPTFTPAWSGTLEYTYYDVSSGEVALSGAPKNAGSYKVKIAIPGSDATYTGEKTINFTIDKVTVTITADSKSAYVGDARPELTYTVTGLVSGDTLATVPTLDYESEPDMSKAGSVKIKAKDAVVPNMDNYESAITYVDGTLTITAKSSGGGGGSSSGGSSSSGGGSSSSSGSTTTPVTKPAPSNTINTTEGSKGATNTVSNAVKDAIASGVGDSVSARATFKNFDFLAPDGLKAINAVVKKESAGKAVDFKMNMDKVEKGVVVSRIAVDPAALAKVMTEKLPLDVYFNPKHTKVSAVTDYFEKHFTNKVVSVVYEQKSALPVDAEFCAKLDLENTFGQDKQLYFYTYDNKKNSYTLIANHNYRVDKNGYAHINAPLGGSIIISDKPLTKR